jgi:FtsP/CotA-like multicopper oxidase with cupredoxin domain
MDPTFRRVALIAAVLGLLVSLFVVLRARGGDDGPATAPATTAVETTTAAATTEAPPATTADQTTTEETGGEVVTIAIEVAGGRPTAGIDRTSVSQGQRVRVVVTSDVADEIHLHGYDLSAEVAPGQPATIEFVAETPGRFEVELEGRGVQLADLEVRP